MSYWTRTIILQQPDAKVVTILMTIILTIMLTMMMTMMMTTKMMIMITTIATTMMTIRMINLISGARAIRDEVHKDYEVASKDEQLQLLPRNTLSPRLGTNQTSR